MRVIEFVTPLKSFSKKPRTEAQVRAGRRAAQGPARQPATRAVVPMPAQQGNALSSVLVVVVAIIQRAADLYG